ncbi:hypothetical protein CAP31_08230 [Sulfuriferula sp. AH1]|uniref:flagellar hook-length control protein FliK n=1 Tax=Sulfuriferula sp. AH1 TaxID=1985873 RepID=UPI000B3B2F65|nr:flagellar hook-length control protein FliK [Sulfuriferula sp. AH1]ARU31670.1 hypothetical protein CAP31_08230 [Sulfuriferula sp. AH1]
MAVTPIHPVQPANLDKTTSASTPDVPFNQVLSNEMAQHQDLKKPDNKNASQADQTDARQSDSKLDTKSQADNTSPQPSAEMLAILGHFQSMSATPHEQTVQAGSKLKVADKQLMPVTTAPALAAKDVTAEPALGIPHSVKQSAGEVADNLAADPKSAKTDMRIDSKFTAMLKNAETMNNNPHAAHAENDITPIPATVQNQLLTTPIQPALVGMVQNPTGSVTDKLTPRVGTPAWDQGFSQKIVWMAGNATQTASISLNPPDLGPLQVVLNVTNDQANATFIAAQPEVRLAIEAALPKLREMMSDAGIQLGQANVSAGTSNQQGSQSDSRASRQSIPIRETVMDNVNVPMKTVSGQGLVNTFV